MRRSGRPKTRWKDTVREYMEEGGLEGGCGDDRGQDEVEVLLLWPPGVTSLSFIICIADISVF